MTHLHNSTGTIATIATYPFDIMRTQFAVQETTRYFHHIPSYIQYTYKTYGMRGNLLPFHHIPS